MQDINIKTILPIFLMLFVACDGSRQQDEIMFVNPEIYSVYNPYTSGATIPVNICPITISYFNRATTTITLTDSTGKTIETHKQYFSKTFSTSLKKWQKWLQAAYKGSITIKHPHNQQPITHIYYIAEPIDPYISYRKTLYSRSPQNMYIEERNITSFNEKKLIISSTEKDTTNTCINCHNIRNHTGNYSLIHIRPIFDGQRSKYTGTFIIKEGKIIRINPPWGNLKAFSTLTYPDFHPTQEKIIFSTNTHTIARLYVNNGISDLYPTDTLGIIVLYDINTNTITTTPELSQADREYSFPVWNAAGSEVFFLGGRKCNPQEPWNYLLDLYKISYDTLTNTFGKADVIFPFSLCGMGATMPRPIPGTNKIIVTVHKSSGAAPFGGDSDYYIIDMDSTQNIPFKMGLCGQEQRICSLPPNKYAKIMPVEEVNTTDAEKWHNFSSNGRWMVFTSTRLVGEQNYPHIVYVDKNGKFGKPFAMPQKDPLFFTTTNVWDYLIPNASKTSAGFENLKAAEIHLKAK